MYSKIPSPLQTPKKFSSYKNLTGTDEKTNFKSTEDLRLECDKLLIDNFCLLEKTDDKRLPTERDLLIKAFKSINIFKDLGLRGDEDSMLYFLVRIAMGIKIQAGFTLAEPDDWKTKFYYLIKGEVDIIDEKGKNLERKKNRGVLWSEINNKKTQIIDLVKVKHQYEVTQDSYFLEFDVSMFDILRRKEYLKSQKEDVEGLREWKYLQPLSRMAVLKLFILSEQVFGMRGEFLYEEDDENDGFFYVLLEGEIDLIKKLTYEKTREEEFQDLENRDINSKLVKWSVGKKSKFKASHSILKIVPYSLIGLLENISITDNKKLKAKERKLGVKCISVENKFLKISKKVFMKNFGYQMSSSLKYITQQREKEILKNYKLLKKNNRPKDFDPLDDLNCSIFSRKRNKSYLLKQFEEIKAEEEKKILTVYDSENKKSRSRDRSRSNSESHFRIKIRTEKKGSMEKENDRDSRFFYGGPKLKEYHLPFQIQGGKDGVLTNCDNLVQKSKISGGNSSLVYLLKGRDKTSHKSENEPIYKGIRLFKKLDNHNNSKTQSYFNLENLNNINNKNNNKHNYDLDISSNLKPPTIKEISSLSGKTRKKRRRLPLRDIETLKNNSVRKEGDLTENERGIMTNGSRTKNGNLTTKERGRLMSNESRRKDGYLTAKERNNTPNASKKGDKNLKELSDCGNNFEKNKIKSKIKKINFFKEKNLSFSNIKLLKDNEPCVFKKSKHFRALSQIQKQPKKTQKLSNFFNKKKRSLSRVNLQNLEQNTKKDQSYKSLKIFEKKSNSLGNLRPPKGSNVKNQAEIIKMLKRIQYSILDTSKVNFENNDDSKRNLNNTSSKKSFYREPFRFKMRRKSKLSQNKSFLK